jgi:glycosyltransferase involved in cell wall biosynthesis
MIPPDLPACETVFDVERRPTLPSVTVIVPLHNYAAHVGAALESVRNQTLAELDLIVVDDASTDGGGTVVQAWLAAHGGRFRRARLLRHPQNAGLAVTRNRGFVAAATPFVLPLDADNELYPTCLEKLLRSLQPSPAAFAFCLVEQFGPGLPSDEPPLMHLHPWNPDRLTAGNYIDAMCLLRRAAWEAVGGYTLTMPAPGWEDYDLWLKLARASQRGLQVPQILARYRVHPHSMLRAITNRKDSQSMLRSYLQRTYPERFPPPG